MANGTREDVERIDEDDPRNKWPNTAAARKQANTLGTKHMFEHAVRDGRLRYVYDAQGERLFNPEDLEQYSTVVDLTEKAIEADTTATVLGLLKGTNRDITKAFTELLKLATEPVQKLLMHATEQNIRLHERLEAAYEKQVKTIETFEAAVTLQHERELERVKTESQEKRLNTAVEKALEQLPNIIAGYGQSKTVTELKTLFESLTDGQKEVIFNLLTPEQLSKVAPLMQHSAAKAKSTNGAAGTARSGPSTPESSGDQS